MDNCSENIVNREILVCHSHQVISSKYPHCSLKLNISIEGMSKNNLSHKHIWQFETNLGRSAQLTSDVVESELKFVAGDRLCLQQPYLVDNLIDTLIDMFARCLSSYNKYIIVWDAMYHAANAVCETKTLTDILHQAASKVTSYDGREQLQCRIIFVRIVRQNSTHSNAGLHAWHFYIRLKSATVAWNIMVTEIERLRLYNT